jgi:hypothetical protein
MQASESQEEEEPPEEASVAGQQPQSEASLHRHSALRNHRIRFEDAIDPNAERVTTIHKHDILLGRGKAFQDHSGNKRMRQIIDKYREQYHSLQRSKKRGLVETVYREIVEGGARFLTKLFFTKPTTRNEDCFVLVDGEVALQKVHNTLRCKKGYNKVRAAEMEREGSAMSSRNVSRDALTGGNMESLSLARVVCGGFPSSLGVLPSSSEAFSSTDTLQLAAFNRYGGLATLGSMPLVPGARSLPSGLDYYNMLRRDQLLRETMLLQQMEDARIMDAARISSNMALSHGTLKAPMNGATPSFADGSEPTKGPKSDSDNENGGVLG